MKLSIRECLTFGWNTFKKRPWFFISIYAVFFIVMLSVSYTSETDSKTALEVRDFVLIAVSILVGTVFEIILINLALKAHENTEDLTTHDLFSPMPFVYYLLVKILVGVVVLGGLLLLIVPGIIAILMFAFAPYILIDRKMKPLEALKESARITRGHRVELLLLVLALSICNIAGALVFFIGVLVTAPVSALAFVHAYRTLEHWANEVITTQAP